MNIYFDKNKVLNSKPQFVIPDKLLYIIEDWNKNNLNKQSRIIDLYGNTVLHDEAVCEFSSFLVEGYDDNHNVLEFKRFITKCCGDSQSLFFVGD